MNEDTIGVIKVERVEEHEDGSATFNFEIDGNTKDKLAEVGLEFVLYCAAFGWDMQDALDSLEKEVPEVD